MDEQSLKDSLNTYEQQLVQVNLAIATTKDGKDKEDLFSLKNNIEQLIQLTKESFKQFEDVTVTASTSTGNDTSSLFDREYASFMSEMGKEGALLENNETSNNKTVDIKDELKAIEGMKCKAPHKHQWGDVVYHNALICSVIACENYSTVDDIEVKVMFINPTHEEMLPCPYLLESSCKFDDDKCKYSHGEVVPFSSLKEYTEPKFEQLTTGSKVLAKQKNKLWVRATIKRLFSEKCLVKLDSHQNEIELEFHEVLPLDEDEDEDEEGSSEDESSEDHDDVKTEHLINMSLMNTPTSEALGGWEKYTKGIGSKLMHKMGYIVGTGLGKASDGRISPVSAIALPPGKSLDHCMNLREKSGGDKDLFSVERKLRKMQKRQEIRNRKMYERETKKVDVFNFLNETLSKKNVEEEIKIRKSEHRREIKSESLRSLNVAQMKVEEEIKRVERDMVKIRDSLKRHSDVRTQLNKNLRDKLVSKQLELKNLKAQATNITNEQSVRSDKRKLTIF